MTTNANVAAWQARTPAADVQYYTPAQTNYYQQVSAEKGVGTGMRWALGISTVAANSALAWAEWAAHQSCVHGNEHSITASVVLGLIAGASAAGAVTGFVSKTDVGSVAGAVLAPTTLILGGFGVMLWSPSWPAALAGTLILGALNAGIAAVWWLARRILRRMVHEAGLADMAHSADLQKTQITENGATTREALKVEQYYAMGYAIDRHAMAAELDLHLRHPEIVRPPRSLYGPTMTRVIAAEPEPLALQGAVHDTMDDLNVPDWLTHDEPAKAKTTEAHR